MFGTAQKSGIGGTKFGNSVFNSSALLGGGNYSLKDEEEYCEELNLGLQDGQSEENINMREVVPEVNPNSLLNLSRVNSITERYLNFKTENSDFQG